MSHALVDGDPTLTTMTLRRWLRLDQGQRAAARERLERCLGEQFVLFPETGTLPILTHRSSGLRLVLVFGDRILMGATDAYRHRLRQEWAAADRDADGRTARFLRTPDPRGLAMMTPALRDRAHRRRLEEATRTLSPGLRGSLQVTVS